MNVAALRNQQWDLEVVADPEEIARAVRLMLQPGEVYELRCPKTARGVVSGYFGDHQRLVEIAAAWSGRAEAVYVTLNPVTIDLLARVCNRVETYVKTATSDHDVLRRRLLLVDFDAVRPAGISSTEAERELAIERARSCALWLQEKCGWAAPLIADSGNGGHLLCRIDQPNDERTALEFKKCLEMLANAFDDDRVKVDVTTFNASRISKLYGTLVGKGDHVPELGRVHRIARILEVPKSW